MLRLAGIVALFVLAACNQTTAKVGPSPSPVIPEGNWNQSLTLTGELPGHISGVVPDAGTQQTYCSGGKARTGDTWSDTFYASVDGTGNEWQVNIVIENFRGPGTYMNTDVKVALMSPDNSQTWLNQGADTSQNLGTDKVMFTIARSQQTGTIEADLTNATSGKRGSEHIAGTWNCRG